MQKNEIIFLVTSPVSISSEEQTAAEFLKNSERILKPSGFSGQNSWSRVLSTIEGNCSCRSKYIADCMGILQEFRSEKQQNSAICIYKIGENNEANSEMIFHTL